MKTLTKIIVASSAGILSAGLCTAGAFAATGAFSLQDQAGSTLGVSGVNGSATHAAKGALSNAEQKANTLRGALPATPALPSGVPSSLPTSVPSLPTGSVPAVPAVPATGSGSVSGSTSGSVSSTAGSGSASGSTSGAAGTSGVTGAVTSGAKVVTPPAAVDVRGTGSVTVGH